MRSSKLPLVVVCLLGTVPVSSEPSSQAPNLPSPEFFTPPVRVWPPPLTSSTTTRDTGTTLSSHPASPTSPTAKQSSQALPAPSDSNGHTISEETGPVIHSSATVSPPTSSPTNMTGRSEGNHENRTLVITLSVVGSVVGLAIILGTIVICYRYKRGRIPFQKRGVTPIDDDEIESWRVSKETEKVPVVEVKAVRKPPSVIVYQNTRTSMDHSSPCSPRTPRHTRSFDLPQTPMQARAPNSRPGLTDETVEGDVAFIPTPKRQPSRLSKQSSSPRHMRSRSSRSSFSISSVTHKDTWYHHSTDVNPSPRLSHDYSYYYPRSSHSHDPRHARAYSNVSVTRPRISFEDDFFLAGLSPRPLLGQNSELTTPASEIGRAIG